MRVSLLLIVIPTVIGVPACINQFNPPQNRNALTWYPSNFTKTTVPMFPNNFDCEYGINVPQGWFVQIQLSVTCTNCNVGKDYDVVITDQLQRTERVSFADEERFYFIANGGKIKLTTRTDTVQFGFTMLWQPYSNTPPALLNVSQSDTQPTLIVRNGAQPAVVRGETKVSATVLAPQWWDENQYFRGVIFFDGPTWNATCLGTASQLSKGNTQYVSSGNYMSVLILEAFSFDYIDILLQDYSHTKDIVQFQGMECNWSEQCLFVKMMDASMGPVVFQTYTPVSRWPNVITGISGTGNLDVYIGGITSSNGTNLIASYQ
ncbi:hypothetical protein GCK72_015656 [Caenorhabditis remanei]|uniref:Uncharacterized protein n=1 Tax=Caenorhabditis remanei TaxID=31234 RepID=A0A6A5GXE6_CAERE|nr:hypothetical protein GCK72_015656 [Caenorhabditis remanei]KAF1759195.1 hypothetical protein GCK72_015656 [Caenorhabditis remanei]